MVDVSQFQPNEITVKTTDKDIIVHGIYVYSSTVIIMRRLN